MLGDLEAVVAEVKALDIHGVTYYDVALTLPDGATQTARLGPEGVPDGLKAGDPVLATMAANMIVSLRRP